MNIKYSYKNYLNLTTHTVLGSSIQVWSRLLAKNKFRINIYFIPKAIFITLVVLINAPVQLYEHLRYRKKTNRIKITRPVFIIGHYRSGTTYLHNVLSKDPNFSFCSTYQALTPNVFLSTGNIVKKILGTLMPATRPQDNVKSGADKPGEEEFAMGNICEASLTHGYYFPKSMYKIFDECVVFESDNKRNTSVWQKNFHRFLQKLSYRNPGKQLLLKSPANTARIKEIQALYPDACFIHIHRNPYTVYQSNVNLYEKILPLLSFQKPDNAFMEDFILYAYQKMYKKFLADKNNIPSSQLFEMSYDDFVASPLEQLQKAYSLLNLGDFEKAIPFLKEEINEVKNYQTNTYTLLNPEARKKVEDKWNFMFDQYGYKTQN